MVYDPLDKVPPPDRHLAAEQVAEDFKWLMRHGQGRRIVRLLLAEAGVWRSTFHTNPQQAAFNEGMRCQGLRLLDAVSGCPEFGLILKGEDE